MNLNGIRDVNQLRALLQAGALNNADLNNTDISGSLGPQDNALAQVMNPRPVTADLSPDAIAAYQSAGGQVPQPQQPPRQPQPQPPQPQSTDDMRAQGQQFVRNEDTGQTIMMPPQPSGAGQAGAQTVMHVVGMGTNGITSQLPSTMAPAPQLDMSRPQLDIPGLGKATYGKGGGEPAAYIRNPDGSMTKVLLGYDQAASMQMQNQRLGQEKTATDIAHTQEETRASRANNPDFSGMGAPGGAPASLDQLDPGTAATVKSMLEGRMQPPGQMALRNPRVLQLINAANAIDPSFDATTWATRYKTAQDFASGGKSGQAITSFSTLLDHANDVAKTGAALNNFSGFPFSNDVNDIVNNYEGRSGDPRVTAFVTAKTNFDNELAKAMTSGHITDSSIAKQAQTLTMGQSDAQRQAALKEIVSLLGSKINETGNAYIRGMGKTGLNPTDLLTPGAKATYLRYMGSDSPAGTLMNQPQGAVQPQAAARNIPAASIAALRANPATRSDFDAKYGQGAAAQVLGS